MATPHLVDHGNASPTLFTSRLTQGIHDHDVSVATGILISERRSRSHTSMLMYYVFPERSSPILGEHITQIRRRVQRLLCPRWYAAQPAIHNHRFTTRKSGEVTLMLRSARWQVTQGRPRMGPEFWWSRVRQRCIISGTAPPNARQREIHYTKPYRIRRSELFQHKRRYGFVLVQPSSSIPSIIRLQVSDPTGGGSSRAGWWSYCR